ncbi:MAG: sigma-54-dependent transcriptional regulator [bacterium]
MIEKHSLDILMVDDEEIVHNTLAPYLRDSGHHVDNTFDGNTALQLIEDTDYDLIFIDIRMPGIDGITLLTEVGKIRPEISSVIMTGHGNMEIVIKALRLGAVDFLTKPIKLLELDAIVEKSMRIRRLRLGQRHLKETIRSIQTSRQSLLKNRCILGKSQAMREVNRLMRLAVDAGCETILISGETGTGKEVIAREIHNMAGGGEKPFIAVNCPALPDTLVESELFGHVKGAFTGATSDKAGFFELADGGTLFLDEVADLSPAAQAKLLRVIETRKIRRVGGSKEIEINIKIIAATNIPLEELVKSNRFRNDLFFRLNQFTIKLLPLRKRRADILPLAEHFLSAFLMGRRLKIDDFSEETRRKLLNYDFPGNVRELRNLVEHAAILCQSGQIQAEHLNFPDYIPSKIITDQTPDDDIVDMRKKILLALEQAKWNRREAAKNLGMPYSSLRYKIQKLGIC